MPSPWYSKADEHPRGEMLLRAGETFIEAYKLTEVDPDMLTDIAPKDLTDYQSGGDSTIWMTFAATQGGAAIVTTKGAPKQAVIQGDPLDGTVRLVVRHSETQTLWDNGNTPFYCSVWGINTALADTGDDEVVDLLWTFTAAVLPATA